MDSRPRSPAEIPGRGGRQSSFQLIGSSHVGRYDVEYLEALLWANQSPPTWGGVQERD